MAPLQTRHALLEDGEPGVRSDTHGLDRDWDEPVRGHAEDPSWAAKRAAVSMAAATIRARDGWSGDHCDDVTHLCDAIAQELGLSGHERSELLAAAQLHDVGKVAIPQEVLDKPGPLSSREWTLIREHTIAGERIVQSVPELKDVARLVRHSHERWDGGGYPDGLAGEHIPRASRIVFCADAFHAIRSDRPYRRGRSARAALAEVRRGAGSQFDPEVVEALAKAARRVRNRVRSGASGVAPTLRSRRVMSLLLTLAIGGSALAAGGSHVLREDSGARERDRAASSADRSAGGERAAGRRAAESDSQRGAKGARDPRQPQGPARDEAGGGPSRTTLAPKRRARSTTPARAVRTPGPRPAVPSRRRVGRPASPGRSQEAPRRPTQTGRPVGGAPGRSEEAPGRPDQTVARGAPPVRPLPGLGRPPALTPRDVAKSR